MTIDLHETDERILDALREEPRSLTGLVEDDVCTYSEAAAAKYRLLEAELIEPAGRKEPSGRGRPRVILRATERAQHG